MSTTVQSTFTRKSGPAFPGMIADIDYANRVLSFAAEGDVEFGYGVFRGTLPEDQAKISGAGETAGYIIDTTVYPIADQDTKTLLITRKGETARTVLFASATTSAAHVIAAINTQLGAFVFAEASTTFVKITDLRTGKESGIAAVAGTATLILFADAAVPGTDTNFLGVAVRDHTVSEGYLGKYGDERVMGVLVEGPIWIELETTGAIGDPLTIDKTSGRIGTNAVGGNYVDIKAILDSAATSVDQLVRIKLAMNA